MNKSTREFRGDRRKSSRRGEDANADEEQPFRDSKSTFCKLVASTGLELSSGKEANVLSVDQAAFCREFEASLKQHAQYPRIVREVISEIFKYLEDDNRLEKALAPTETSSQCTTARAGQQASVVRLLLSINDLQKELADFLLETLYTRVMSDEAKNNFHLHVLNQFRWHDGIVETKHICERLCTFVGDMPLDVQRDIVLSIPDIATDPEHYRMAKRLQTLLISHPQLNTTILDALGSLCVNPNHLVEIRQNVLKTLPTVDQAQLPIVVGFILRKLQSDEANEVILSLRRGIDFRVLSTSTPYEQKEVVDYQVLTVNEIRVAVMLQKFIADAWLRIIDAIQVSADMKVLDLVFLLIYHSVTPNKRTVETALRNKIRSECLTLQLVADTFKLHPQVLKTTFQSILNIASVLLKSTEACIFKFASFIYRQTFCSFTDSASKAEVISNLVSHVASQNRNEMDEALCCLAILAREYPLAIAPYGAFVESLLEYLGSFTLPQLRMLFTILATLAYKGGSEGAHLKDRLHIVTRKQLGSHSVKYMSVGVIASAMLVNAIASSKPLPGDITFSPALHSTRRESAVPPAPRTSRNDDTGSTTSRKQRSGSCASTSSTSSIDLTPTAKEAVEILELARDAVRQCAEATALLYDELSALVGSLETPVEQWICSTIINDFDRDFVLSADQFDKNSCPVIPIEIRYAIDSAEENTTVLNLAPFMLSLRNENLLRDKRHKSLMTLCPLFRLGRLAEQFSYGASRLTGVDALFGCGIIFPTQDALISVGNDIETRTICASLVFYAINWLRELINSLSEQTNAVLRDKIALRIRHMVELMRYLEETLPHIPEFVPPLALFDCEVHPPKLNCSFGSKAKSTKGKRGRKRKLDEISEQENINNDDSESQEISRSHNPNSQKNVSRSQTKNNSQTKAPDQDDDDDDQTSKRTPLPDLTPYHNYFRELDLSVFLILDGAKMRTTQNQNTESEPGIATFTPRELRVLLRDLNSKLDHALVATEQKRLTFLQAEKSGTSKDVGFSNLKRLTPEEVAEFIRELLRSLCILLESTGEYFQNIIDDNDGVVDAAAARAPEALEVSKCMQLLLGCINSFFSWTGFTSAEHGTLLRQTFRLITDRAGATQFGTQCDLRQFHHRVFTYFANIAPLVPDIVCAAALTKLLRTVLEKTAGLQQNQQGLVSVAEGFLKREWSSESVGSTQRFNECVRALLSVYLEESEDQLATLNLLTSETIQEILEDGRSSSFAALNKSTLSLCYKSLYSHFVECVKIQCAKNQMCELKKWKPVVTTFGCLTSVVKKSGNHTNLAACLKNGRMFVDVLLRHCMPTLDRIFATRNVEVLEFLRSIQQTTRFLQHVCAHSKNTGNATLTKQVPLTKKSLETFVFRVKSMLALHKCSDAFLLGNLKNRNLQGEEIHVESDDDSNQDDESSSDETGGEMADDSPSF